MIALASSPLALHALLATAGPRLDVLALFGFLASFATVTWWCVPKFWAHWYLTDAVLKSGVAAYAFLGGTWPVGMVLLAASAVSLRREFAGSNVARRAAWYVAPRYQELLSARAERLFGEARPPRRDRPENN